MSNSCLDSTDVKQGNQEIKGGYAIMATREAFEAKLKERINGWNVYLDKLEADTEAKIKYEKQIKGLRQKTEEAQKNLIKIHHAADDAGDDAWEELKQGAKTLWNMYENSFKKAKSEFKWAKGRVWKNNNKQHLIGKGVKSHGKG